MENNYTIEPCKISWQSYLYCIYSTLSWKPHVSELSKKLARNCGIFYKIRHFVKAETLKLLYYSLFHSFLSYGVTVRGLTHPSITYSLYKLQKKVIRAICFEDKYDHTTSLFHKLITLKLYDMHSLKLLCFVYDCTKDQPVTYFDNFFTPMHLVHQHFTRQASKGNLFGHIVNTTHYYMTNSYRPGFKKFDWFKAGL